MNKYDRWRLFVDEYINDRTPISAAMSWLLKFLTEMGGSMEAEDLFAAGEKHGHSKSALFEAKRRLGVRATRIKMEVGAIWIWRLQTKAEQMNQSLRQLAGVR